MEVDNPTYERQSPKYKVKKAAKFLDNLQDPVPTYRMRGRKRAAYLIINIIEFNVKELQKRTGSEIDEADLLSMFGQMDFVGQSYTNLTHTEMARCIDKFTASDLVKGADCVIVVVMSHGTKEFDKPAIYSSDGVSIPVVNIGKKFNNKNCPKLAGIPKIFLFQFCRGEVRDGDPSDDEFLELSYDSVKVPVLSDMLFCWSTVPGYKSVRQDASGTWFIQAVCKVWSEHACERTVEDLMKIVQDLLNKKKANARQTTYLENKGFKKCYLNPGLYE